MIRTLGCLFLIGGMLSAQQVIEPRIVSETRPAGSLIQIKVDITSPRPISTTGESARLESDWFDSVEGVSIYSPAGDAYGAAVVRNGVFTSRLVSPFGSLGTQLDYPFLMIAARIRPGLPLGAQYTLRLDSTTFQAPDGSTYTVLPKEGTLTIGGAVSIFNVIPGGGILPAGATVRILGTGFNSQTRVDFDETVLTDVRVISPTELNVTLGQSTQMSGRHIRIRGQGNDEVEYFSYLRAVPLGSSTSALMNATHPVFSSQVWRSAGVTLPSVPAGSFAALALQNSLSTSTLVQLELVSAAGFSLGSTSFTMTGGTRYARTAQELFGAAAVAGTVIKVTATGDIHVMGLVGNDAAGVVTPFAAGVAPVVGTAPLLSAAPASLTFSAQAGGASPASRTVNTTSSSNAVLSYTAAANQSWLLVTPNGGSTPGSIAVSVNPAGLAAGTYNGAVTLTPPLPSTPVTIAVTFTVNAAAVTPQLAPSPAALTFEAQAGSAVPAARAVTVGSTTSAVVSFTAAGSQSWLAVTPSGGWTPGSLAVSVNPAGLAAGTYSGAVTLTPPAPSAVVSIPVTLTITAPPVTPQLTPSPASLSFDAQTGGAAPAARSVNIVSTTGAALAFSAASNQAWLAVTPNSGSTPGTVSVSVNPAGLAAGVYNGAITLTPPAPSAAISIPVTLTVAAAPVTPQLSPSPATLAFEAQAGGAAPTPRTLTVTSTTAAVLAFTAVSNHAWLSVTPNSGSTPGSLSVSVNPAGLAAGSYIGGITLTPPAPSAPVTIAVNFTVTAAPATPQLATSPAALTFDAQTGGAAPTPRTVTVTSTTNAALAFSAASNQAWLSVTPNSGATPGAVSVSVNPAGLAAGTYSGAVTLTPPSPSTPVSIPVTLTVTAAPVTPQLATAPAALAFNAETGAAAPAARAVTVTSTTSAVLSFTAAANQSWLLVTPNGGSTPGSVSVSVNLNGLAAGSYSAVVTLTPPSPSLPVTIPVTLTVATAPVTPQLAPSPAALAFEAQAGGAVPAPRPVNVASTTSAVLSFTATSNQPWLAVTPNGGSTPGTLSVSVNTTGLAAGTYSGSVTLTPPLPSAPFVIPVTLTVTSPPVTPQLTPAPASLTFEAQSGGAPPAPRSLTLTSSTGAALAFSASGNQPWLAVTPATASTPGAISASVNQAGLAAGVYGGAVTLTPPSPSSPITIPVTFTVTAAPVTPQLTALPAGLTFDAQAGGNATQAQTVSVSSSTGAALTYTVAPNAAWLLVSASAGSTPGAISISVNPSTLAAGQFSGSVTLTPPAPSTPLVIPVSVRVTTPPAGGGGGTTPQLSASPASMAFTAQGGTPSVQTRLLGVSLANANAAVSYSAAANVPWLSLSPAGGFTPGSITVTASSAGLSPGVYNGVVTLSAASHVLAVNVPVTLTVTETTPSPAPPPPQLASTASPLNFTHVLGAAPPAPQSLRIENRATGAASVAVSLRSTVAWLSVSPVQGVTPLAVTVTLQPSGLAAGSYDGAVLAAAAGGSEIAIPVRLTVSQPGNAGPLPGSANLTALVNAASQTPGAISPGALVTIYGSGLGPGNGQSGKPDATGHIEKSVAGTRVWFGAFPAPVLFASSTQVNAIVPFEVQGLSAVDVAVEYQGQRSTPRSATVIPAAPALFTLNASGAGPAAALNQDYTVNSPSAPARRGTVIVLYATGFGAMPGVDTGQVAGADLARPNVPVTVTIGGIAAEILYAGSAPGLVQGVVQLNVLVPPNSPAGQPVAVQVTANGRASQAGVTIAVE